MNKFIKRVLIVAGCFLGVGVVLGCIGAVGGVYENKKSGNAGHYSVAQETWDILRKYDFHWLKGRERGLVVTYDDIEYDENHDIVYASFTDDSLRAEDIYNLDLEIGGGKLVLRRGDKMELKKDGGSECQYYIEGSTFYLKQKTPVGAFQADFTLTLPEGIDLEEVDIEMGAGEIIAEDVFTAERINLEVSAGEITIEEVKAGHFSAEVATGTVVVKKMDAGDCEVEVNMGNITLQDSFITGNLDAEVNMGDMDIFLRDSYENHDYEVNCSMGDITIVPENGNSKEFSGLSNAMELSGKNVAGDSVYDLTCSMGSILVRFSGGQNGLQEPESMPELKEIYGIEDNWPESIGRENKGTTAENFSFEIRVSEPMTLVISCVTESGELDLEIENEKGKDIFEKDDIQTGSYTVNADSAGIYKVSFDCENHTGSFWIRPES